MLITGIRHKIKTEKNARIAASFIKYLVHFLKMFAFLGIIIPLLLGIDYCCKQHSKNETVTYKYCVTFDNTVFRRIYTDTFHDFFCDSDFYDNTNIGDKVTYSVTPIFSLYTNVSILTNSRVYICILSRVYIWLFILSFITVTLSIIVIIRTDESERNHKSTKFDYVVNIALINTLLCIIIIVAVLLRTPY